MEEQAFQFSEGGEELEDLVEMDLSADGLTATFEGDDDEEGDFTFEAEFSFEEDSDGPLAGVEEPGDADLVEIEMDDELGEL